MTFTKQLQRIVDRYRSSGEPWPASSHQIAAWAIRNREWQPEPSSLVDQCANQLANAMRAEVIQDPQGRIVRTKHAARYREGEEQYTLWADIRDGSREHMAVAFQQRRKQIVGDCRHLKTDVDSFNENRAKQRPILMSFDFEPDLAEAEAII